MRENNLRGRYGRYLVVSAVAMIFIAMMSGEGYSFNMPIIIYPTITASPSPATAGQTITVTGQMFSNNASTATVNWGDGSVMSPAIVNHGFTVTHNYLTEGIYKITAADSLGDAANTTLTVKPVIAVSPNPATAGNTILVSGFGFMPNNLVSIVTYDGPYTGVTTEIGTATATGSGLISFSYKAKQAGSHMIYASDHYGIQLGLKTDAVQLTVSPAQIPTPVISLSPNPVRIHQTVHVTGQGFTPNGAVKLYISAPGLSSYLSSTSDSNGGIIFDFTPNLAGPYIIKVGDSIGNSTGVNLMVNPDTDTPTPLPGSPVSPIPDADPSTPTPGVNSNNGDNTQQSAPPSSMTDGAAPVTMLNLTGTEDGNGGFTSDVTCSLNATDNASGVSTIQYGFDGSAWYTYTKPFSVVKPGTTTVYYRSTDNAGNTEVANVKAIVITAATAAKPSPAPSMAVSAMALIGLTAALLSIRRIRKN